MISEQMAQRFARLALSPDPDLAVAALMIARLEYPKLDASTYIDRLDALGHEATARVAAAEPRSDTPDRADPFVYARIAALNDYLFREERFCGNDAQYEDPRNSCLNEVLDRRTGIPITLALVYMEVARRAGVAVEGINFPGHFLIRCSARMTSRFARGRDAMADTAWLSDRAFLSGEPYEDLIIDAYHGGALLSETACRQRLREYSGDETPWDPHLLVHATKPQILARMLVNLKRVYVKMYSFPQARDVTELLLAVDPSAASELRDRGLLAYHLNDFSAALRDLQAYLRVSARSATHDEERKEQAQIWEHVKSLRRRVASLN